MDTTGNLGTLSGILLVMLILIGAVGASVIMNGSEDVSEEDYTKMVDEVVDEISTYVQVKNIIGKYELVQGEYQINKIAILIRPLVSPEINTLLMSMEISDGEQFYLLFPSGQSAFISSYSLFDHPLWENTTEGSFSILAAIDEDHSLIDYQVINKNTDTAFLIVNLPSGLSMNYGDTIELTLLPAPGIERSFTLETPLPTHHVVSLY